MPYVVEISPSARREIDESLAWLRRYSETSAVRWRDRLLAQGALLSENPLRFPLADEADELGIELRELTFGKRKQTYRVLFTVTGNVVRIHHLRHSSRDSLRPKEFEG